MQSRRRAPAKIVRSYLELSSLLPFRDTPCYPFTRVQWISADAHAGMTSLPPPSPYKTPQRTMHKHPHAHMSSRRPARLVALAQSATQQ